MDKIIVRDVQNKEIHDSYMGILRISPNEVNGIVQDDPSTLLNTPGSSVELSESDGNALGVTFIPCVFGDRIFIQTNVNSLFVSKNLNIRSTLKLNSHDKVSSLIVRSTGTTNVQNSKWLLYPIESPNDDSYFNTRNSKFSSELFEGPVTSHSKNVSRHLHEMTPNDYALLNAEDEYVKDENGKVLLTANADNEAVPIMQTRDYVLGTYDGHTFKVDNVQDIEDIFPLLPSSDSGKTAPVKGDTITKLSWLRIDELIWKQIQLMMNGQVKSDGEGRFKSVGFKSQSSAEYPVETFDIEDSIFGRGNTRPLYEDKGASLAQDFAPGCIAYNATNLHRFMFHVLRQRERNRLDENKTSHAAGSWQAKNKSYSDGGLLTAYKRFDKSFTNNLTKHFLLCDGRNITYDDYPSIDTNNKNLFQQDAFKCKRVNGIPLSVSSKSGIYNIITKTPVLLNAKSAAPVLVRGDWNYTNNIKFYQGRAEKRVRPSSHVATDNIVHHNYDISIKNHHNHFIFNNSGSVVDDSSYQLMNVRSESVISSDKKYPTLDSKTYAEPLNGQYIFGVNSLHHATGSNNTQKLLNSERDSKRAATNAGGWNSIVLNWWAMKYARHRKLGKCLGNYINYYYPEVFGGAYVMSKALEDSVDCMASSLPIESTAILGTLDNRENRPWFGKPITSAYYKEQINTVYQIGDVNITADKMIPRVPSLSLLPLIRI